MAGLDEVRLSDVALTPSQFLDAGAPEPGSLLLIGAGLVLLGGILHRRK